MRYDARDSSLTVDLPLDPMHGTVGVAPPLGEVRSSLTPGRLGRQHGHPGDARRARPATSASTSPGALFSLGDGHARQGEGETCGVAVECAMDTVLVVDLVKGGHRPPWPRLEDDTYLMTTGSTKPLEDAFRIAHADMVRWVAELTGLSPMDAYQLVSQTALTPVANVVDTDYTVVCKVAKAHLPGNPTIMQGARARCR